MCYAFNVCSGGSGDGRSVRARLLLWSQGQRASIQVLAGLCITQHSPGSLFRLNFCQPATNSHSPVPAATTQTQKRLKQAASPGSLFHLNFCQSASVSSARPPPNSSRPAIKAGPQARRRVAGSERARAWAEEGLRQGCG